MTKYGSVLGLALCFSTAVQAASFADYAEVATKNAKRYLKIDQQGDVLPDEANVWTCVYDHQTGLLWEEKTDDNGLRDKDWQYTWYNDQSEVKGYLDRHYYQSERALGSTCGQTLAQCNIQSYQIRVAEQGGLCGQQGWHVPTKTQLASLITEQPEQHPWFAIDKTAFFGLFHHQELVPIYLNKNYFQQLPAYTWYWSSDTAKEESNKAVIAYFAISITYGAPKSNNLYVRLVKEKN
ncbi:DUF1566 domain-containing protein [Agitococcus lubricus]|uniref:Uncharacterized protein DUF1566 n=1 Tax=Agitococcus lubricus TaxID=1077255 RepID=A0A2T5IX40_9GAMM|nr:DUF1566 domain-containing protein [Agitococcus lubricus]PTQ88520.1 uncharacterized protein DUF1566 [Agitococcus lubricus]